MLATRFLDISGNIVARGGTGAAVMQRMFGWHVTIYRRTGGRVGHRFPGMPPFLLLEHTGAKSGTVRVSPLGYMRDGANVVLIGSNGGGPRNPAWIHNLRAHPDARVWIGADEQRVVAHRADAGERALLWPKVLALSDVFTEYEQRTDREIPLVVLEPA